jgi:hypothetical protein
MVNADGGLPAVAQPEVFHKDGRRLFIIDGEPRVADEDIGFNLELKRERNVRTDLIDPYRENLLMLGPIV